MAIVFKNTGESSNSFADEFLVQCPHCHCCASVVRVPDTTDTRYFGPRRLVCTHCGHTKDCEGDRAFIGKAQDWFFGLPLWLQLPCCGDVFWAYNGRHLDYIERYVAADLREEQNRPKRGWPTDLPEWIKSAKNRDEILRCLAKLKQP